MEGLPITDRRGRLKLLRSLLLKAIIYTAASSVLLTAPALSATEAQSSGKNVLFIFSVVKYSAETSGAIEPDLRSHVAGPINFYYAYLDDPQPEGSPVWDSMAEALHRKYAGVKMDVVIADVIPSLLFALKYRDKVFPKVPIVFLAVNQRQLEEIKLGPGVTGVTNPLGFRETTDLALRLQPDTQNIAVIAGVTPWDTYWLAVLQSELAHYQNRVKEIDLVGTPNRQMLERIAALPPHTVAMFQVSPQYSDQPDFTVWDLVAATAQRLPMYSVWPRFCINGCIGGVFENPAKEWATAAELAARVLSGEPVENIPIQHSTDLRAQVDWRAVQRWHIPESALPPGSEILFREPTLWQRDRNYILSAVMLILLQALLIVALLWQRARKRKAEAVLRESEKRFRVLANTTPAMIWMCDEKGETTYLNDRRITFTNPEHSNAGLGDTRTTHVHPDDLNEVLNSLSNALKSQQSFSNEYRLRRHDGVYRWVLDIASPRTNGDGSFAGFIGSAIDITDQKLAQEALKSVSGRLIEAQEEERRRIARELHDDIAQRVALLSVEIAGANGKADEPLLPMKARLEEIGEHCAQIGRDIQSLSHQLHSSKLDYLGLVAAVRSYCNELAKQHHVLIGFREANIPPELPRNLSLCLFRLVQEALHNAIKYSGTHEFTVQLNGSSKEIELIVTDKGKGFDVQETRQNAGLGLISMQERVRLVQGRFSIQSQLGEGTRVMASVPLGADSALIEPQLAELQSNSRQ